MYSIHRLEDGEVACVRVLETRSIDHVLWSERNLIVSRNSRIVQVKLQPPWVEGSLAAWVVELAVVESIAALNVELELGHGDCEVLKVVAGDVYVWKMHVEAELALIQGHHVVVGQYVVSFDGPSGSVYSFVDLECLTIHDACETVAAKLDDAACC